MNITIKTLCLTLSLCVVSVGVMQPGEYKRSESTSDQDSTFPSPETSLRRSFSSQSSTNRGSVHSYSIDSLDPQEDISTSKPNPKVWHQVVCVEIHSEDDNEALLNHFRRTSPRGVIIRSEQPISSFNAKPGKNMLAQKSDLAPIKPSRLQRLARVCFCCCN